jgi:hypothetical protein
MVITKREREREHPREKNEQSRKIIEKKLAKERKCKLQKINKKECVIDLVGAN